MIVRVESQLAVYKFAVARFVERSPSMRDIADRSSLATGNTLHTKDNAIESSIHFENTDNHSF